MCSRHLAAIRERVGSFTFTIIPHPHPPRRPCCRQRCRANRQHLTANSTRWSRRCRFGAASLFGSGSAGLATYPSTASKTRKKLRGVYRQAAQPAGSCGCILQPPIGGHSGAFTFTVSATRPDDQRNQKRCRANDKTQLGGAGVVASVQQPLWIRLHRVGREGLALKGC
jgi:hypothetical protein